MKLLLHISSLIIIAMVSSIATIIFYKAEPHTTTFTKPEQQQMPAIQVTQKEADTIQVIDQSDDAVVSVIVTKDIPVMEQYFDQRGSNSGNPFFDNFFNFQVPQYRQNGTEQKEVGGGTAFFISKDGLLLTNKHVVNDQEADYTILLNDERKLDAKVVATDPNNDIALIKVEGENFAHLPIADNAPVLGQTVIAIGNSLGEFRNTVSVGVVSGLQRSVTAGGNFGQPAEQLEQIIQTDAAINQGNSGGPLLSSQGQVLGMNTAIAANAQNIGFAIPASDLQRAIESYNKNGKISAAYLGIRYIQITPAVQEKNNLEYDYGVLIAKGETQEELAVIPNSPAAKAGLLEGDIIVKVDEVELTSSVSFARIIGKKAPGESVTLDVDRNGEEITLEAILEEKVE